MLNTREDKRDFSQRYIIMHGTGFLATADTLKEVDEWRAAQDDMRRHFHKVGDHKRKRIISGAMYGWWRENPRRYRDSWYKW